MAPGLVVAFPDAAKQIARYRVEKFAQAQRNIRTAYQSSQNDTYFSPNGAVFPWVSGRYGNCTAAGPCFDYEYHINGDIGLEFYNYYTVTGDTKFFQNQLFPIYDAIAQFYADLVTYNKTSGQYDLYNGTDPVCITQSLRFYPRLVSHPCLADLVLASNRGIISEHSRRSGAVSRRR